MTPTATERDAIFQNFARALFKNDMDALYAVVTENFVWRYHDGISTERVLTGRDAIQKHIEERKAFFSSSRFHDVAYRHLSDISFMTFRVSETVRATGEQREQQGIERYTFEGGKLATKDVYGKPIAG
jgi:ketosteroid isomerase-like protein